MTGPTITTPATTPAPHRLAVPFRDVRGAALRWALDLPAREALATKVISLGDGAGVHAPVVELRVLGASHQVLVRNGTEEFSETVACDLVAGEMLPANTARPGYGFTSSTEVLSQSALAERVDDLVQHLDPSPMAIVAGFPGDRLAVTALELSVTDDVLTWQTWHAYPQAGELVRTHSQLVLEVTNRV
ncbi:hypothetical protein BJ980_003384 [Nocardioides daedukensis]|uniref:DUF2617 family protein n=1 Tax=Nocardioides daedukensis TaxID=634462 RepID=A0A7Y9US11_9ACTN|nr:DUF2617 family protein [Nocardioides daedukensis]NYG60461.1 hypothetical protein [Nocardioides daedukensis]